MRRRLLHLLTALSLVLCVAAVALWVRSYSRSYVLVGTATNLDQPPDPTHREPRYEDTTMIESAYGGVQFTRRRLEADVIFMGASDGPPESGVRGYAARRRSYPLFSCSDVNTPGALVWTLGGFQVCAASDRRYRSEYLMQSVTAPWWFVVIVFGVLPASWLMKKGRQRTPGHICDRCGYDLRATPGKCPECGTGLVPARTTSGQTSLPPPA